MIREHNPLFVVVDLRTSEAAAHILDWRTNVLTSIAVSHLRFSAGDHAALVALAPMLCENAGGEVEVVIFLTIGQQPAGATPHCIGFDQIPVFLVDEATAFLKTVPSSWTKFQFVDCVARKWWLVEKRAGETTAVSLADWNNLEDQPAVTLRHAAAFGYQHAAVLADSDDAPRMQNDWPASTLLLSKESLWAGACLALRESPSGDQSTISWSQNGNAGLHLSATRRISYPVLMVSQPIFSLNSPDLADAVAGRPVLLVIDQAVERIHGQSIRAYAATWLHCLGCHILEGGERSKHAIAVGRICRQAAKLGMPRNGIMVAVGGGVVLDVVGLAASLFRRGIGYLRIPTTLVGLIDAGLGIKQGVNFASKKNLLGAFYPPLATLNDPSFLVQLPHEDISCGIAEIIKIALVRDGRLFGLLERHGRQLRTSRFESPATTAKSVLFRSCLLMIEELQTNLYETELRRLVDFGHTFSPAIETESQYAIPHGVAVAMDMLLTTALAVVKGRCRQQVLHRLADLFDQVGLPSGIPPCSVDVLCLSLVSATQHRGGKLNLVIPVEIGSADFVQDVKREEIEDALLLTQELNAMASRAIYASAGL